MRSKTTSGLTHPRLRRHSRYGKRTVTVWDFLFLSVAFAAGAAAYRLWAGAVIAEAEKAEQEAEAEVDHLLAKYRELTKWLG